MEFKDLPVPFQEMAANIVRSQLATLDLSTVEKETIDTISGNVRRAFIGLCEEKQLSDNQDLHEKYFLELMDIINKGFGGNDSNLLIVFYVQIMPDDFVMQLHR
ncbi:hypothetical protein NQ273_24300, partial [Escherichia coli]|nr:hypothetical protein [Escherichia coli]